jgi:hypothetical protein
VVKTTLELKDEVYKKLINKAIEEYGNTKSLSRVVNESLEAHMNEESERKPVKKEADKWREILKKTAGSWGPGESGKDYVRRIRDESERKRKRRGV